MNRINIFSFLVNVLVTFACFLAIWVCVRGCSASTVGLDVVSSYNRYYGCAPIDAASIFGYYDLNGYDNLFDANGWNDISLTENVKDHISRFAHNYKYDSLNDKNIPDPLGFSLTDFFYTSENGLSCDSRYVHFTSSVFVNYASYRGYTDWDATLLSYNYSNYRGFTWIDFTLEIDAGRPLLFIVDSNSDGYVDHAIPVFGYNDITRQYACYTTWHESEHIDWYDFQEVNGGNKFGVGYATFITPGNTSAVPIPNSILLLAFGVICLILINRD